MFDISERSAEGMVSRWRFAPVETSLPLEMRFHANLSLRKLSRVFTLPSRWSRVSRCNHAQARHFVVRRVYNACHADGGWMNPAGEQNRQFKDRPLSPALSFSTFAFAPFFPLFSPIFRSYFSARFSHVPPLTNFCLSQREQSFAKKMQFYSSSYSVYLLRYYGYAQ